MLRRGVCLFAAVALLTSVIAAQAADGLKCQYKLKPGTVDKYRVSLQTMPVPAPGVRAAAQPTQMVVSMVLKQKILGLLPDGNARVSMQMTQIKMKAPGQTKVMDLPSQTMMAVVNRQGKVVKHESGQVQLMGANAMGNSGAFAVQFPARLLRAGDTWTNRIPVGNGGYAQETNKLVSASARIGSAKAAKIVHTFSGRFDLPGGTQPGQTATRARAEVSGSGVSYFAADKGKILKSTADLLTTMRMGTGPAMKMRLKASIAAL